MSQCTSVSSLWFIYSLFFSVIGGGLGSGAKADWNGIDANLKDIYTKHDFQVDFIKAIFVLMQNLTLITGETAQFEECEKYGGCK